MSWVEDTVSFRGVIRRSGNSLIATIPPELSQRFLIREGQEFTIVGMSRYSPDFEGALQIYLGFFKVLEKAVALTIRIAGNTEVLDRVEEVARRYGATRVTSSSSDGSVSEFKIVFGVVEKGKTKIPRKLQEIRALEPSIRRDLEAAGLKILASDISEEVFELREIDPAVISKSHSKLEGAVTWKWEI
ncbi:hypothetical protein HRbin01_01781 [archaeon HR01]|nr:hypothetical protein HRbin01_01781 [archaeon HR01]